MTNQNEKNANKGMEISKSFYLLSFLPAIAYWYLEENYSIKIAVIGGMGLACIEILLELFFVRHVHSLSKLNFVLLFILGPISLIGEDGLWFKLQPMFTGIILYLYLFIQGLRGESLMWTMSKDMNMKMKVPKEVLLVLERHMAFFLLLFGLFMGVLAKYYSTSIWAFFKTIGFYICFGIFMIAEMFYFRFVISKRFTSSLVDHHKDKNQ
ncbi:septation protein IspZ [Bacteriovorax sp. Seq25_V]|uniref:septation protein IspZ n=1 Tax=Bacteriovorax sp. Seq25_V TaxID=1201288 RepID=UPI00054E19C2|nr:septation protein IspZ [Bacteriovorax sp. Seq25_V]